MALPVTNAKVTRYLVTKPTTTGKSTFTEAGSYCVWWEDRTSNRMRRHEVGQELEYDATMKLETWHVINEGDVIDKDGQRYTVRGLSNTTPNMGETTQKVAHLEIDNSMQ